ncbi:MAG: hypothetical protein JJE44_02345 [Flavobacteriaceae bacterium]|nr:hypothetical protein [Flavobacteriaceae bacterium]
MKCELNNRKYETGIKVPESEMINLNIEIDEFHGEWN